MRRFKPPYDTQCIVGTNSELPDRACYQAAHFRIEGPDRQWHLVCSMHLPRAIRGAQSEGVVFVKLQARKDDGSFPEQKESK